MGHENESLSASQKKKLKIISGLSAAVDYSILIVSLMLLIFALYAMYDSHKVYELADSEEYIQYKPSGDDRLSYEKLLELNPDVIGWIEIYGTKIDYPVLQTTDNHRYLDETVTGEYSTAGSIFLDYRNAEDFSDFNSVIYGHHMDERKMFGDIDKFIDENFFKEHAYGVLHRYNKPSLGIEFFSIIKTEGTDQNIFTVALVDEKSKRALSDYLYDKAIQSRPINISENDRMVLLNTCTFTITNGRYILAGKLSDNVKENPFPDPVVDNRSIKWIEEAQKLPLLIWLIVLLILLMMIYGLYKISIKKSKEQRGINDQSKDHSKT